MLFPDCVLLFCLAFLLDKGSNLYEHFFELLDNIVINFLLSESDVFLEDSELVPDLDDELLFLLVYFLDHSISELPTVNPAIELLFSVPVSCKLVVLGLDECLSLLYSYEAVALVVSEKSTVSTNKLLAV